MSEKVTIIYGKCETEGCHRAGDRTLARPDGSEKFVCWKCAQELVAVYGWRVVRLLP